MPYDISAEQKLEGRIATVDLLKKLHEAYPDNQKIALEYAKGLGNLSFEQKLPELADTLKRLEEIQKEYPDNQKIAQVRKKELLPPT